MDSAPGGHFALYFTIKSLNRAENRRRKRCRSKVLGFGLSGTVLGRSGAVCEVLKKLPGRPAPPENLQLLYIRAGSGARQRLYFVDELRF